MKVVHVAEVPLTASPKVRGGSGHSSRVIFDSDVLNRDPQRPDNFFVQISYLAEGEFNSPRHRHDFEQFRYMINGEADYPEGKLTDGVLGYFPEGAYYGPQQRLIGTVVVMQFGGPSGSGFVDRKQLKAGFQEMEARELGEFRDGIFRRNPGVEGRRVQDSNEAVFEYIRKRPLVYPDPQYATPILINTNAFPWLPLEGAAGVEEKALGTFSSCRTRAARYRLATGTTFTANGRGVYMVLSGSGSLGREPYGELTTLYLEEGEESTYTASETTQILLLGLPLLALMRTLEPAATT